MLLEHWMSDFLLRRGLQVPDQRPLFAYRASPEEYESLRQLLCSIIADQQRHPRYAQAWLLFAAEWWKREYTGGAWRWAPLLAAVGQQGWSHAKTSQLVIEGRRQWRLQTAIKEEGKRFIGLVAVNGGLVFNQGVVLGAHRGLSPECSSVWNG